MTTASVQVEVEVDLSEFDDDTLIGELKERGYVVAGAGGLRAREIYDAITMRRPDADQLAREFVAQEAGRILT